MGLVTLAVVLAAGVAAAVRGVRRLVPSVPAGSVLVVERLGRYRATLEQGRHVLVPFLDRVRATVDLRERVVTTGPQPVVTADNRVVHLEGVVQLQVTDPRAAVYQVADHTGAVELLAITAMRQAVGSRASHGLPDQLEQVAAEAGAVLQQARQWGVQVRWVRVQPTG